MIRVNADYIIDVDDYNFTVKEDMHRIGKDGKPVYVTKGYYSDLVNALKGVRKAMLVKMCKDDEISLKTAIECVKALNTEFENRMLKKAEV